MRAATMKERPSFPLMRQTDVQSIYHMQMPRWLFSDPRYAVMSLDAKVAYTFLLNIPYVEGAEPDLGEAVRPGRRQPDLSGHGDAPG